jgi:5-methyltetrahydrofolate--homocysteine methyltransferase
MNKDELLAQLKRNVILGHINSSDEGLDGDMEGQPGVTELTQQAIDEKLPLREIIDTLSSGMEIVGERFEAEEYLMPDMLASAECVGDAMGMLDPHLRASNVESKGIFVIATVEGDLHDIGKNIVVTMLKGAGYDVKDLGINVPAADIVAAVKKHQPSYLGLSALLTTTMVKMREVIELMASEGVRDPAKVLIGGAPTSEEFAKEIGADAYCRDAFATTDTLKRFEVAAS